MTSQRFLIGAAAAMSVAAVRLLTAAPQQQPTFRAAVDLVAVDVQVVDKDGTPVKNISPDRFEVLIDGHRRRVVSADFISSVENRAAIRDEPMQQRGALPPPIDPVAAPPGRVYMIAIDVNSFNVGESRGVVSATRAFLHHLQPDDLVGVFAYPLGPKVYPTADRLAVDRRLDTIVGNKQAMASEFHLTATEIIDINAESAAAATQRLTAPVVTPAQGQNTGAGRNGTTAQTALFGNETDTTRRVQQRECDNDLRCVERIESEAQALAFLLEGQITEGLSSLSTMLRGLGEYPGRKTVVLMSGGVPVSDRPGGRPDAGNMAEMLARNAAEANTSIYAVHVDSSFMQFSAETQKSDKQPVSRGRDNAVLGHLLDQFAGQSGGEMLRVLVGSGEGALDRVLRETSSHYLLGVEPAAADRDGRLRELRVKVNQPNVTVRSRMWVVVPKRRAT